MSVPYQTPGADIVSIIDAPPHPADAPGARRRTTLALVHYEAYPAVADLARPYLALGGLRIDPVIAGRQRTRRLTGLSVLRLPDGRSSGIELPDGRVSASVAVLGARRPPVRVHRGRAGRDRRVGRRRRLGAPPGQLPGLRVRDVLGGDPTSVGVDGALVPGRRHAAGPRRARRAGPAAAGRDRAAAGGDRGQALADGDLHQDLLRTDADADAFEALATTVPLRVDPESGAAKELGPPGLYRHLQESPDGAHLLVHRLTRPFSFRVPWRYFARRVEVWSADGAPERVIADLPVSDEVPRQGVPTGPRDVCWAEAEPARLLWTEALDGGDPLAEAEHRDRVLTLAAPFTARAGRLRGWSSTAAWAGWTWPSPAGSC